MSVADNYAPVVVSGTATEISFVWQAYNQDYLVLELEEIATGTRVTYTLGADYTVVLDDDGGGIVTIITGSTASYQFILSLNIPLTQESPYKTSRGFQGQVIENSFDKLTSINQQQQDDIERSIRLPVGTSGIDTELPSPNAGKAILWNATGDALENSTDDFNDIVTNASASAASAASDASDAETARIAAEAAAASLNIASPSPNKHGALLYQNDTDDGYAALTAQGTAGQILTSNGSDAAPSWQDAGGWAWEVVSTGNFSSASEVTFTNITKTTRIILSKVTLSTASFLRLQTSTNNGVSYDSGASDYIFGGVRADSAGTSGTGSSGASYIGISGQSQDIAEEAIYDIEIIDPQGTTGIKVISYESRMQQSSLAGITRGSGFRDAITDIDAIRIFPSAGNITGSYIVLELN